VGNECTFEHDQTDPEILHQMRLSLSEKVAGRLRQENYKGKTITLKLRYENFQTLSHSRTITEETDLGGVIFEVINQLWKDIYTPQRAVRLIGVSVSGLTQEGLQLDLFPGDKEKASRLSEAMDTINSKYSGKTLGRAALLLSKKKKPGTLYK
jgi:DNA polymerase-4